MASRKPEMSCKMYSLSDVDCQKGSAFYPWIIDTFLESYDFSGKKIVLFATSGSSCFGKTLDGLKGSVSADMEIVEGKLLNGKL